MVLIQLLREIFLHVHMRVPEQRTSQRKVLNQINLTQHFGRIFYLELVIIIVR